MEDKGITASDLRNEALRRYDGLFAGVTEIDFLDFPDYPNVGDSAIALGLLEYFRLRGVAVRSVHSVFSLRSTDALRANTVVINGGGSLGGVWPEGDTHRARVLLGLPPAKLLIQAPQTIEVVSTLGERVLRELADRPNTRLGVRDWESFATARTAGVNAYLAPDSAHILELTPAAAPTLPAFFLIRSDKESNTERPRPDTAEDWLTDSPSMHIASRTRRKMRHLGPSFPNYSLSAETWKKIGQKRLARGISMLSKGEIVITDRLHAMLLSHSIGRPVRAFDNSNRKLSRYLTTWGPLWGVELGDDSIIEIDSR